MQAAAVP